MLVILLSDVSYMSTLSVVALSCLADGLLSLLHVAQNDSSIEYVPGVLCMRQHA